MFEKGLSHWYQDFDTTHALETRGLFYWRGSTNRDFTVNNKSHIDCALALTNFSLSKQRTYGPTLLPRTIHFHTFL